MYVHVQPYLYSEVGKSFLFPTHEPRPKVLLSFLRYTQVFFYSVQAQENWSYLP